MFLCWKHGSRPRTYRPLHILYQRKLFEAACVNLEEDSEKVIARKISSVMLEYEDMLICNNLQFDVSNGNIIKYAVVINFDVFINDMASWGVNFNKVDATDDRTVLDYVQAKIERNKGLATEQIFKNYYEIIRKAGGKHKWEL